MLIQLLHSASPVHSLPCSCLALRLVHALLRAAVRTCHPLPLSCTQPHTPTLLSHSRTPPHFYTLTRSLTLSVCLSHLFLPLTPASLPRSARFYVRALQLNSGASHVWGYLRTSLVG